MARKKAEAPVVEQKEIDVLKFETKMITIPIKGRTSLIMSKFSEKSKRQIQEIGEAEKGLKQGGKKKHIADPQEQYEDSIHYLPDGKHYGFPAVGVKAAMVDSAYRIFGRKMTDMRAFFYVEGIDNEELVTINGTPRMREDMVRVGTINKVASPRYRAEFPEWSATIKITFVNNVITEKELVAYLQAAGFCCGIGEWRPEKGGQHGMFNIAV